MMTRWIALLAITLSVAACAPPEGGPDRGPETALADYVARPDASFEWRVQARHSVEGAEIVQLVLQSQTWRGIPWKHQLFLIKPEALDPGTKQGLLVIGGGRWHDAFENEPDSPLPDGSKVFIEMANRVGTIVTVIGQVPFQPMFDLSEDNLIAYTFEQYLASGDPDWPLLLPMVKSAVRAMDTATAVAGEEWAVDLERFTVLGGSKRGWTTWLTGAVDPRAAVLVPVVIDALNFAKHMPYQSKIWGAPSEKLAPYTERNLIEILGGDEGAALRTIVDPYSYRQRLTQPKLIVVATNDEYFPLDSMNLYWDDLPDPKYALYLPNEGHNVDNLGRLISALDALHNGGTSLPKLEWEFENHGTRLRLCVRGSPAPVAVAAWSAVSADSDFRDESFVSVPAASQSDVYVIDVAAPSAGYKAVFGEALFANGADERLPLSTNVRIMDSFGRPANDATAIVGERGICP